MYGVRIVYSGVSWKKCFKWGGVRKIFKSFRWTKVTNKASLKRKDIVFRKKCCFGWGSAVHPRTVSLNPESILIDWRRL